MAQSSANSVQKMIAVYDKRPPKPEKKFRMVGGRVIKISNDSILPQNVNSEHDDEPTSVNGSVNENEEIGTDSIDNAQEDSSGDEEPKPTTLPDNVTKECNKQIQSVLKALNEIIIFREYITKEFETNETVTKCLTGLYKDFPALQQLYEMIDAKQRELKSSSDNFHIPDVFIDREVSNYLKMFKSFFWSYNEYATVLVSHEKKDHGQFSAAIERAREKIDLDPVWSMESRIYTVYNCLFTFELLMKRYMECFSSEKEEHKKAKKAFDVISSILNVVNEGSRQTTFVETHRQLSLLSGRQREPKINATFIHKGPVKKIARRNGKIIARQFVLFSDCLYLTLLPNTLNGQSSIRAELTLEGMKVGESKLDEEEQIEDTETESSAKVILNVKTKETDSDFIFDSIEQLEFWKDNLLKAIGNSTETDSRDDEDIFSWLGQRAPRWQRDNDTRFCNGFNCSLEFTAKVRRHHCRADGLIYCDHCCNSSIPLSFESRRTENLVCHLCYGILFSYTPDSNPEKLKDAKQKLTSVFKAKTRRGLFQGWVQMQTFSKESHKLSRRAKFFAELQVDPFLKLFKYEEDKKHIEGIMLVGMKICEIENNNKCQYHSKLKENMFSIEHIDRPECYVFTVKSDDCQKWKDSIKKCIKDYLA